MIDDDRGTLRTVAWSELLPWLILFRCFRISIGLRPLLLSSVAAVVTVAGWAVFGWIFSGNPEIAARHQAYSACPWNDLAAVADNPGILPRLGRIAPRSQVPAEIGLVHTHRDPAVAGSIVHRDTNPILGTWEHLSRPFREVFTLNMGSGGEFRASNLAYSLLCALWALAVWAFAGGAVTRVAAVQLASGERVGWSSMIGYARSRWRAYVFAPLFFFLVALFGTLLVAVFGFLLMQLNVGLFLAAILWPLVLAGCFLLTLALVGLAFGWPLMFAAISTEGTDSFDAISRSYAYVSQKPLRYLFYAFVVTVVGVLGWLLVFGFTQILLGLAQGAASWGSGGRFVFTPLPSPHVFYQFHGGQAAEHLGWLGDLLIRTWNDCVRLLAVGYLYSYFWVSASAMYLLLRRDVDDTELDEVYLDSTGEGEMPGLPPIVQDASGAPVAGGEKPLSETE